MEGSSRIMKRWERALTGTYERIVADRVVAIARLREHTRAVEVVRALHRGGVRVIELTLDHPDALVALRAVADAAAELPGLLLGAGTVRTVAQLTDAAAAGARFAVSPHTDAELIRAALDLGLEPLPGAATPTEVATAVDNGAKLVKLFPAGPLGLAYLRALRGPFGGVDFVPTGGIRHDAVGEWLAAGAVAVGLGSDLVPATPSAEDIPLIEQRAKLTRELADAAR
jgi:Entner-Doudoroff aldolase